MYEELIASLRERAETRYDGKAGNEARVYKTILSQAADAIEALSKKEKITRPHGRLIDADALIDDLKRQCKEVFRIDAVSPDDFWITRDEAYNERLWKTWCEGFYEYVGSRPTIIPAEEA